MSTASLVINVSDQEHLHSNGLTGPFVVPAKKPDQPFAMLVVYPREEIQDQGDRRGKVEIVEALDLAKSVIGFGSNSGSKEKWGLLLCEAQPDLPKELLQAIREERDYLNKHRPDMKMRYDAETGVVGQITVEPAAVTEKKIALSETVRSLHAQFEKDCHKLVTKAEIERGKRNLQIEDQRLVAEGDRIHAGPEPGRVNINELHKKACVRLGQERAWCYIPQQLIDCPGCGAKIKENVLACSHCAGWLDEGIEELRSMKPKERAQKMYPERYAEPVGASGIKK